MNMKNNIADMGKKLLLLIVIQLLILTIVIAANDPGHDTLYIEEDGDSELNGTLNITDNMSVQGGIIRQPGGLILYGDDSIPAPGVNYISGTTGNNIYIDAQNNIYLKWMTAGAVFIGSGPGTVTDLNVSGALYVQGATATVGGTDICLENGTNCPAGANETGNVTGSGADNRVALWTGSDTLSYDGNLTWNRSAKRLGIGTTSPAEKLEVEGGTILVDKPSLRSISTMTDGVEATLLNGPDDVFVSGRYAYVTSYDEDSLSIIDIFDPYNPIEVGTITDGAGASALNGANFVHVVGKYAYVTSWGDDSLSIIDVSDPSNPVEAGYIMDDSMGGNATELGGASGIQVIGKYAYIVSGDDDSLSVIDVSDPTNPTEVGTVTDGDGASELNRPEALYVYGQYAYVTTREDHSLSIINISDPTNPTEVGSIVDNSSGGNATYLNESFGVYVSGQYAFVASTGDDALSIFNVSNVTNPTEVAVLVDDHRGGSATALKDAFWVEVSGKYAYVSSGGDVGSDIGDDSLVIVDISNITNPTEVASIVVGNGSGFRTFDVVGKYIYMISYRNDSFYIFEIDGIDAPAAEIGNLVSSEITVWNDLDVGNNLYVRNSLNVGPGGIKSDGDVSFADNALTTNSNSVGIGTISPNAKLQVNGSSNQLRISYDDTNHGNISVNSGGNMTITANGHVIIDLS